MKLLYSLLTVVLFALSVIQGHAQEYQRYLSAMPSVAEITQKIRANNDYTTYVKQAGAIEQLRMMLKAIDGNRTNLLTIQEKRIDADYANAYRELVRKAHLPAKTSARYLTNERVKSLTHYTISGAFRKELYGLFFDDGFRNYVEPFVQEQFIYGSRTEEDVKEEVKAQDRKRIESLRPFRNAIEWMRPICLASLVWFLWAMNRERKKRNSKKGLFTLYSGQREYTLYSFTGEVVSKESTIENQSYTYGDNQRGFRTANYRYEHDRFFVKSVDGEEHAVHLVNSGIMIRPGSTLSALWAVRKGHDQGPYLFFYNHDTKQDTIRTKDINKVLHFSLSPIIALIALSYTLPRILCFYGAGYIFTNEANSTIGSLLALFYILTNSNLFTYISVIAYLVVRLLIQSSRRRSFLMVQLPKLISTLKN